MRPFWATPNLQDVILSRLDYRPASVGPIIFQVRARARARLLDWTVDWTDRLEGGRVSVLVNSGEQHFLTRALMSTLTLTLNVSVGVLLEP